MLAPIACAILNFSGIRNPTSPYQYGMQFSETKMGELFFPEQLPSSKSSCHPLPWPGDRRSLCGQAVLESTRPGPEGGRSKGISILVSEKGNPGRPLRAGLRYRGLAVAAGVEGWKLGRGLS